MAAFVAASALACRDAPSPQPLSLTIATGGTGGVYYPLGDMLARRLSTQIPGVRASALATVASVFNMQAVEEGRLDLAFTQGDVGYLAYATGTSALPRPHGNLRGIAVLYENSVQIVTRADSGIRRLADLKGKRVGVGAAGSGTEIAARIILEASGLQYDEVVADDLGFAETAAQLQDRTLDAGFLFASFPVAALTGAAATMRLRLVPVEPEVVARIREAYPFFRPVTIPPSTYRGQDAAVPTIGVDNLLVCRAGLADDLVHQITRVFMDSLPALMGVHVAAGGIDPDQAPATPIPLHPGAARYYRELELVR
jgi:TRAP transporter TAXI family solute receptor